MRRPTSKGLKWKNRGGVRLAAVAIFIIGVAALAIFLAAGEPVPPDIAKRFETLSRNGNSSCSADFLNSVPAMPQGARLQGSCCSAMALHRYNEQVEGLKQYRAIAAIPPDPYDVDVTLAQKLLASYDLELTAAEQQAYDYAMTHSEE
ncbi:MAG: hypothetical protein ACREEP_21590, partial [Dongiaceae bacterium]